MKKIFLALTIVCSSLFISAQVCYKNELYSSETQPLFSGLYLAKSAFGNLNGDSKPDMVAAAYPGSVNFFIQQSNGSFAKTDSLVFNDALLNAQLEMYDLDNNGNQDAVMLMDYGVLLIYSDGAGHVASLDTLTQSLDVYSFGVGDYNNDGITDIILSCSGAQVLVYAGTGSSNFVQAQSIHAAFGYMRIADMNNDGIKDVVYSGDDYDFGTEDGGILTIDAFDTLVHVCSVPYNFDHFMRTADMNNDGLIDIQMSNGNGFVNYTNTGAFTLNAAERVGFMPRRGFDQSNWFVKDMNNDGAPDVVLSMTNNTVIYFSNGGIIDSLNYATFTAPEFMLGIADMDQDGDNDIVMQNSNPTNEIYTFLNNGRGDFEGADYMIYQYGGFWTPDRAFLKKLKAVDLDQDGFPEIVAFGSSSTTVFHNNQNRTWNPAAVMGLSSSAYDMCLDVNCGFLNADAKHDFALLLQGSSNGSVDLYYGVDGIPGFYNPDSVKNIVVNNYSNLMALADFNNDNKDDVLVTVHDPGTFVFPYMVVYMNDGNGNFPAPTYCFPSGFPNGVNPESQLVVTDYDNDNDKDVFFISGYQVAFFNGLGGANFDNPVYINNFTGVVKYLVKDVNNDNYKDVVMINPTYDSLKIYLGNAAGFTLNNSVFIPSHLYDMDANDVNNDGKIDITGRSADKIMILLGQGNGNFIQQPAIPMGITTAGTLISADVDNNGYTDIIAARLPEFSGDYSRFYLYYADPINVSITAGPDICTGRVLNVEAPADASISWFYNGNLSASNTNPLPVSLSGVYTATVTNNYGCSLTSDSMQVSIVSCDSVWPGDANLSGVCDATDLLSVGLNYGASGIARILQDNNWSSHASNNWGVMNGGIDLKFSDCNGDGVINANDTLAIDQNFSFTHSLSPILTYEELSTPSIYLRTPAVTHYPGQFVDMDVWLGSSSVPVNDLYGIAFNIDFDYSLTEPGSVSISFPDSWLALPGTTGITVGKTNAAQNTASAGVSRIDHFNADGFGRIATLRLQLSNSITVTTPLTFTISGYTANDSAAYPVLFNSQPHTIIIEPLATTIQEVENTNGLIAFPNPYSGYTSLEYDLQRSEAVKMELFNMIGERVYTLVDEKQAAGPHAYRFSAAAVGLSAGVYFVRTCINNHTTMKRIVETK